jgi:hypothetical protein
MVVTAAQVADTLRLLVPGFLLAKAFYLFGLRTKRSDAQWLIWSLIAAVPINAMVGLVHAGYDNLTFLLASVVALAIGSLLGLGWQGLVKLRPSWTADAGIRSWDNVFGQVYPQWLQVLLTDKTTVYAGRPLYAAQSVDTDDLDLYLVDPRLVVNGRYVELPGVDGVLVARSQIAVITVFSPPPT